jgi:hypothetical protein
MPSPAGRLRLTRHPAAPPGPLAIAIDVTVARPDANILALTYEVTGRVGDLVIPSPAPPVRANGLWRHTCFEAFVRAPSGDAYAEFNFSPSGEWAAYGFSGYREGMTPLEIAAPQIEVENTGVRLAVSVRLALGGVALAGARSSRLGISAVIEEAGGRVSYWALAHPPAKPDFHHRDSFVYEL